MSSIFSSASGFVVGYFLLMVPTYVLPYFGSNSVVVGAIGAVVGRGLTPQWWIHAWCLTMLVLVASVRGKANGRSYLMIFPIIGGVFDLTPVLSFIPFVPTVMHLMALVLGCMNNAAKPAAQNSVEELGSTAGVRSGWENWIALGASLLTVVGCILFVLNARQAVEPIRPTVSNTDTPPSRQPAASVSGTQPPVVQTTAERSANTLPPTDKANRPKPAAPSQRDPAVQPQKKPAVDKPVVTYIDINK